jgi:hypothetical protein
MLNLSSGGGNGNYIRFSPQANAWTNSLGEEIQLKKVVFDLDGVQTGWLQLGVGIRDWQPDSELGRKGSQPTPDHKRGFIVTFYNKEIGTCEWSSSGVGPNMGLEKLYTDCAAQRAANAGKLPVLEYTGSKLEKIGKGTTRIPNFTIVSWIDRPLGMYESEAVIHMPVDMAAKALKADEVVAAPPASVVKAAPAPAPKKSVMAAAVEDDEMF